VLEAKKAGKVRFIGFTGHKDPHVHLYMLQVASQHQFRFDTVQMPLNVMDAHFRSFGKLVLPKLVEQDIVVLGMKPMGSGVVLKSNTVTAQECLRYALRLPTSVVITGIDKMSGIGPLLSLGFLCVAFHFCLAQTPYLVCEDGSGRFETKFVSGVSATVGPAKSGGLAKRSCDGSLAWDGRDLSVAAEASQVDIDVLGVDLGLGTPVVAFQVRKSAADWDMTYLIYSLKKPPKLLRTITGGDFFSAADTNLNGKIEIWTGDVGAISGFEGFLPGEFDFAPTVVLRFERSQLMDVSAEFQSHFDKQIAQERAELSAQNLNDFRDSDGQLTPASSLTVDRRHRLRMTKMKVLEIVLAYLYRGREDEAWRALSDTWPPGDIDRIRMAILNARAHGIRSQIDAVSTRGPHFHFKKHTDIFDAITEPPKGDEGRFPFVETRPQAILLRRPLPVAIQEPLAHSEQMVELVIDAAGKVWSAKPVGDSDKDLVYAARGWKFIPAFTGGRAVASRLRMGVSPDR
jgi:hypothetical protein